MAGRRRSILALCLLTSCIVPTFSAFASETVNYSYDSRGRLVQVGRSGSVNNGLNACYTYDRADNRTNVAVANANCPSFSVTDVSVAEGSALVFTVVKSGTVTQSHSVNFATSNGTAIGGTDYSATSGTLTFGLSEVAKTVTVPTINDTAGEISETAMLTLSGVTGGATITDAQGVGTIHDDDTPPAPPPSFAVSDASVTEGGSLVFTVTKTASAPPQYYSVTFTAADGTASWVTDYSGLYGNHLTGSLNFGPAETSKTLTFPTADDTTYEGAETMFLNLSAPTGGATITDAQGVGTINNNDPPPPLGFSINDATGVEGGSITFTVTKSGTTSSTLSVNYATADGTATAASDYVAKSGTLSFGPSESSKTITVSLKGGILPEESEAFYVNLSSPTGGAILVDAQGLGGIADDDEEGGGN